MYVVEKAFGQNRFAKEKKTKTKSSLKLSHYTTTTLRVLFEKKNDILKY